MAAATAAVTQRELEIGATVLEAQTAALSALHRAVHAREARRLMDEALGLAEDALRAAEARYEAGETAVLDVNVARVELARARRDQLTAASRMEGALAELREVLALPAQEPVVIQAALCAPEVPALDVLLARLSSDVLFAGAQRPSPMASAARVIERSTR